MQVYPMHVSQLHFRHTLDDSFVRLTLRNLGAGWVRPEISFISFFTTYLCELLDFRSKQWWHNESTQVLILKQNNYNLYTGISDVDLVGQGWNVINWMLMFPLTLNSSTAPKSEVIELCIWLHKKLTTIFQEGCVIFHFPTSNVAIFTCSTSLSMLHIFNL